MLIQYLNTDLELVAPEDLSPLATHFEANGFRSLRCDREPDGSWYAIFEICGETYEEPEATIRAMLTVVESLDGPPRDAWQSCTKREFDIGYECGSDPWAFNNGLTTGTLRRIAECRASLRITIYPERPDKSAAPG
jgi:hypothetical protein